MLYIYLDTDQIKLLHLKKSLLGQYEVAFYKKALQVKLLENGKPGNLDVIASGIKETLNSIATTPLNEKDVILILPQESFSFLRSDIPMDISNDVLDSYLKEKARSQLKIDVDNSYSDYLVKESEGQKKVIFFAINKDIVESFEQPLALLGLKLKSIIPEAITYFKLFEKTLRKNKKENIWYVSYDKNKLSGYVFDSYGLLDIDRWTDDLNAKEDIEKVLHKQANAYENQNVKLNRLILSGGQSDGVRQDTFTKNVGVWTNPLKRIIPHFYGDYLKMLGHTEEKQLPILEYDMLVGAFIFAEEEKDFSLIGSASSSPSLVQTTSKLTGKKMPWKGIGFFLISFGITFAILLGLTRMNWSGLAFNIPSISLPSFSEPTPTPTVEPTEAPPTPTPTPAVERSEVRIKILNGSGISGKAGEVRDFFSELGYEEILTGNADAFDYETTVVQIREEDEDIRALIEEDIAPQVENPEFEVLAEDEASDVIIIVGTDFK